MNYDSYLKLTEKNAMEATQKRLQRIPALLSRIRANKRELAEITSNDFDLNDLRKSSKSFVSLIREGMRISPIEAHEAQIEYLRSMIASDEREINKIKAAIRPIRNDPYYPALERRFFKGETDDYIATQMNCNSSTVRRNRSRLVKLVAAALYGSAISFT